MTTALSYADVARKPTHCDVLYASNARIALERSLRTHSQKINANPNTPSYRSQDGAVASIASPSHDLPKKPIWTGLWSSNSKLLSRRPSAKEGLTIISPRPQRVTTRIQRVAPMIYGKGGELEESPSANLFACLEVDDVGSDESEDGGDEGYSGAGFTFAPFSPIPITHSEECASCEDSLDHLPLSLRHPTLAAQLGKQDGTWFEESDWAEIDGELCLPVNSPPSSSPDDSESSSEGSISHSPQTPDGFTELPICRPSNPTPLEAKFGPYHHSEDDDVGVYHLPSNIVPPKFQLTPENTPRLWRIMGWTELPY